MDWRSFCIESGTTIRDLDETLSALQCVYIHKLLHDNGRLAKFRHIAPEYVDSDVSFETCIVGLSYISDAVWNHRSEHHEVETIYFSHADIMEYYRLCRVYTKRFGVKLTGNPYMQRAARYVRDQLDQGCPLCDYRLQTKEC